MKKNQIIFLHILYWLLSFIRTVIMAKYYYGNGNLLVDGTYFLTNFVCFYINYFFVVPQFFDINKLYKTLIGFFISVCIFVMTRYFMQEFMMPLFFGIRNYAEGTTFFHYFFDNIYYSSTIIFTSTVFCLIKLFSQSEKEKYELMEEKKNAELQALKTQINPHFIFNSLNNIYSLVYQNSDKALPALEELSQLLRYSTKDLEKDFIQLDKEVGYMESLIALEKLRIKNPELILFNKDLKNPKLSISPMLLVPFVENAFKHGDINGKGMELKVSDDNGRLHFYLRNSKKQRMKDFSSGIGIGNVRKRLQLIYPDNHWLEIAETEDTFIVDLKIDLNTNKLTAY
ncbi:histidine kinase [Elizabethkingia anophelis]|nr:histidine kinase [Elizabethkingia anophelis]